MVSIVSSYPGFCYLPRGIKQMLLTSESNFFEQAKPAHAGDVILQHRPRWGIAPGRSVLIIKGPMATSKRGVIDPRLTKVYWFIPPTESGYAQPLGLLGAFAP